LRLVRLPFDGARPPELRRPPELGEHSDEVLAEAGFSPGEIERLLGRDRVVLVNGTPKP
jgi:crotonobetainyl-CoA:carnitine CoA-transferase CaiB-like acyl-CoA transferase